MAVLREVMCLEEAVTEVLGSHRPSVIAGLTPLKSCGNILLCFYKSRMKTSAGKTLVNGQ